MANATSLIAPIGISGSGVKPTIPTGPISLSESDFAKTLPFNDSDVSREVRAMILKRTEQRWIWFKKAEELDEARGTKLGTLGFLPWEIRQMIIERVFHGGFGSVIWGYYPNDDTFETHDEPLSIFVEFSDKGLSHFQSVTCLQDASASMKNDVEHAFLTKTNFEFEFENHNCDRLTYFLSRLTTYQKTLLRSVHILVHTIWNKSRDITADNKALMNFCAQLPSRLTSIDFSFYHCPGSMGYFGDGDYQKDSKVSRCLDLLGARIKRCWAPRAKIGIRSFTNGWVATDPVAFAFEVEEWSKKWLQWWEKSQDGDQIEGQPALLGHSG